MSTILVSGATGFIGSHLTSALRADGHRVVRLTRPGSRSASRGDAISWDPGTGAIDERSLSELRPDAVVNLAGETIAQRWTGYRRREIRGSRVTGTLTLARALAGLPKKPSVLVSGSALGYYGARHGDEWLTEDAPHGSDFLATTALEWEHATAPAAAAGIRVAISRTGLVLGRRGGLLRRILLPFRLGIGARIGHGRQWMSWISLEDMVRALRFLLDTSTASGPFNLVAPQPVQNAEFTKTLGRVLSRPAIMRVPAFAFKVLGTMADNTILASQRLSCKKLAGAGFEFRHPRLGDALQFELRR